jgi:hypothetical protein
VAEEFLPLKLTSERLIADTLIPDSKHAEARSAIFVAVEPGAKSAGPVTVPESLMNEAL